MDPLTPARAQPGHGLSASDPEQGPRGQIPGPRRHAKPKLAPAGAIDRGERLPGTVPVPWCGWSAVGRDRDQPVSIPAQGRGQPAGRPGPRLGAAAPADDGRHHRHLPGDQARRGHGHLGRHGRPGHYRRADDRRDARHWLGWRWVFFVNVPAGVLTVMFAAILLRRRDARGDHRAGRGAAGRCLALPGLAASGHGGGNCGPFGSRPVQRGTGPAVGHGRPARCDLDHIEGSWPPEIDSDTRPFRIDRTGVRRLLITTTQVEASTFPVRCTSFK